MELLVIAIAGVIIAIVWQVFGGSQGIKYDLEQAPDRELEGVAESGDFESYAKLKEGVADVMKHYRCPTCGKSRVTGFGVIVRYGKIKLFRHESYRNWFGTEKFRDVQYGTVWRVHELLLKAGEEGALLSPRVAPGTLECSVKGCGWKDEGPMNPHESISSKLGIRWVTVNDILDGSAWKK